MKTSWSSVLLAAPLVLAFPGIPEVDLRRAIRARDNELPVDPSTQCNDTQTARRFINPPPIADQTMKVIPDADHPWIAPQEGDQRGPCPALNTLANHGYLNRTGIATAEQIINAVAEGFGMEHDLGASIVGFNIMARGNPNTATLSIGFADPRVPPYPGCTDGLTAGGLAKHGRTEGDVSVVRKDAYLGDQAHFQQDLFDQLLTYVDKFGKDGPEGPKSIVTAKVFQEFKFDQFVQYQQLDKELDYNVGRQQTTFLDVALIVDIWRNGTTQNLTRNIMTSFLRDERFPDNWYRNSPFAGLAEIGATNGLIRTAHTIPAGHNDENGTYVLNPPTLPNNASFPCQAIYDLGTNHVPAVLSQQTGIFKENVDAFVEAMFFPFTYVNNCTVPPVPSGPMFV